MPSSGSRMSILATVVALLLVGLPGVGTAAQAAEPGRVALDASRGSATVPANPAYGLVPLTFECFFKLDSKDAYNIIVAHEVKPSATHWELFTLPKAGCLSAYIPGRKPDHVHTNVDVVDGQWHYLAMVLEPDRCRIYLDGAEKASTAVVGPTGNRVPGPLVFGALVTGELRCRGQIDEARLSKVARDIQGVPPADFVADADTIGLWHFDRLDGSGYADSSPLKATAEHKKAPLDEGPGRIAVAGSMSTELLPLPPLAEVAPWRRLLADLVLELKLDAVAVDQIRDTVLSEWIHDYQTYGQIDYPESRSPWYQEPGALKEQVYDRHALLWDADGGPTGTVLRRTGALLEDQLKAAPGARTEALAAAHRAVAASYEATRPARDSDRDKAHYLAGCAVRRQLALANPLLDFDTILCVARGTFAGSVRSNPGTADVQGGHFVTQYFGFNALPGGGLFLVRDFRTQPKVTNVLENAVVRNGRLAGRKLDHGAFATPDLSFDGRTILFAWTGNQEHKWIYSEKTCWHIFRVNVDGTDLVQLTDGAVNDFDPCWLPDGRIAFVSERRGGHIRCFAAYLKVRTYTLFSMNADGSDIVPLSYYETSEWNPTVNHDGQLVYTRWDYTDRENCLGSRIWLCGPDGTNPRAPHGNYPFPYHTFPDHQPWKVLANGREVDSRLGTPLVEMGIRAIPGSHQYVFTAAPHHGEVFGSLCLLDLRVADDGHMSQVRRLTPEEPFPESENGGRRHYKYGSPWPLSQDYFLGNAWEDLILLDRFGNRELLCELRAVPCAQDERLRLIDPIPVRPRPTPPVIPSRTRQGAGTSLAERKATVAVMNVYESDQPFPPGTKIKWLRLVQAALKSNHAIGDPMIGYERENTPRIPLGIVPVEDDGSAYFEAPVAKELIFQVLDENFMAVQSMRSTAFVHPGEQLSCIGCHESTCSVPAYQRPPLAMKRPPSKVQPELGSVEPISYYRQVKPIFEKTCLPCHQREGKGPQDMSYSALRDGYTFWFSGAMWQDMTTAYSGIHGGSRSIPGRFGARNSKIGQALMSDAHRDRVRPDERHTIIVWLDCNSLRLGAYTREWAQLQGELVWPELDVDPANALGIETADHPLKANFWHENAYGPHAFLGTSHLLKRVYLMNAAGEFVWEYEVPNPQDAWLLPNGNVLTTWRHGVREVTRAGETVWEYTVTPPNEVPTCQPLADGNVLVGVVGECRLIELDRSGKVVHEVRLSTTEKTPHAQFRMCRKTADGTYLVPFMAEGAVREYDRDGRALREFPRRPSPVCALRLEDGNTLISADRAVTEYDRADRVVWELVQTDVPDLNLAILAGIQRLPNGNTVVCNWGAQSADGRVGAHIFEVTPDKRVVWQVTSDRLGQVAQCQLLAADLLPRPDGVVR